MYKDHWVIVIIPAFNEEAKIGRVVDQCKQCAIDTILVVDDCSSDATACAARAHGATVRSNPQREGVGSAIRRGLRYARESGYDIAVILTDNNKKVLQQIPRLLNPICNFEADLVICSRYLPGESRKRGRRCDRRIAARLHAWLVSRFVGSNLTDSTSKFRAIRLAMLDDTRIRLDQRWLDGHGLEVYLLWKAIQLGYRHCEVPCSSADELRADGGTRIRPIAGWWNFLRPILMLGSGIRS